MSHEAETPALVEAANGAETDSDAATDEQPAPAPQPEQAPPSETSASDLHTALPPLAGLAALAATADMALNRVLLPLLSEYARHAFLLRLDQWGDLFTNLAAIAGLVALGVALRDAWVDRYVGVRRKLMLGGFTSMLVAIVGWALLFPQEDTTQQLVLYSVGVGSISVALWMMVAFRYVATWPARFSALLLGLAAIFSVSAQVVELFARRTLQSVTLESYQALRGLGEVSYLLAILFLAVLMRPRGRHLRAHTGRVVGGMALAACAASAVFAWTMFRRDIPLVLYNTQRVAWLLDSVPWLYAIPLSMGIGASVAAIVGGGAARIQMGTGMLLLLAAGYAPRSPGRLLMWVLAAALFARGLIALHSWRAAEETER